MNGRDGSHKPIRAVGFLAVSSIAQTGPDKASLPEQEALFRAWCEQQGAHIVATLVVPGHSRSQNNLFRARDEFRKAGITAYDDLDNLCERQAFDVLWCYHEDRVGRSELMYIVAMINALESGANVYSHLGGWIRADDSNRTMRLALGMISVTSDRQKLNERRDMGFDHRAKSGLNANFKPPFSHIIRRDEYGRAQRDASGKLLPMIVDESKRALFDAMAELLLDGIGYSEFEQALGLHGFYAPSGKLFRVNFAYDFFNSPITWGHTARHWNNNAKARRKSNAWAYDVSISAPEGVVVYRNTHEPVYRGEQAERIKSELIIRLSKRGRTGDTTRHLFSGLMVCGECGYTLSYCLKPNSKSNYRCFTRWVRRPGYDGTCEGTMIRESAALKSVALLLEQIVEEDDFSGFVPKNDVQQHQHQQRIVQLQQQHTKLSESIARLIRKQAELPDELADEYDVQITALNQQRGVVVAALKNAERELSDIKPSPAQLHTAAELRRMTLEHLWTLPHVEINHLLHQIFGTWRLVVSDGKITSVVKKP